jgi:TolB-like protein
MSPDHRPPSRLSQFFAELKRRHVVRFALAYAAAAFVVLQLAEIIFPAFQIGETGLRILVVAVALLFPPAMVLAWIYDITTEGIARTSDAPGPARSRLLPGVALLVVSVVVVGAVGVWLQKEGVLDQQPQATARQRGGGAPEPKLVAYDASQPIRSMAVLPLDDFSGAADGEYFTAGMQEELIAQLSQLPGLRVVSRTSVQRYAGTDASIPRIGRDLQVDAVIEGSVRRSGDTVRITVQLIHAASDTHVWTQQYDRAMENVLTLQSEVALDIAKQIQAELSVEESSVLRRVATRSVDPEAQDAYMRGRYESEKGTPEALAAAKGFFEAAVQEDSTFPAALAGLAGMRLLIGLADSSLTTAEATRALNEAARAVALDSASMEAREVLALINRTLPQKAPAAGPAGALPRSLPGRPQPVTASTESPDSAWFQALTRMGRQIESTLRSRGTSKWRNEDLARVAGARQVMAAGLFDQAVNQLSAVTEGDSVPSLAWGLLARAEVASGNPEGAAAAMSRWSTRGGAGAPDEAAVRDLSDAVRSDGNAGFWRWTLDRLQAEEASGRGAPPTEWAAARAGVGDVEGAFAALGEALARRDRGLVSLQKDPVWDVLRDDPRFADLARRTRSIHLPEGPPAPSGGGGPRR